MCSTLIFVAGLALPFRSLWDGSAAARAHIASAPSFLVLISNSSIYGLITYNVWYLCTQCLEIEYKSQCNTCHFFQNAYNDTTNKCSPKRPHAIFSPNTYSNTTNTYCVEIRNMP